MRTEEPFSCSFLDAHSFHFGISYRYRHLVRQPEIAWFKGRLINLHISFLPWNRGADPNLWSFIDNTPKGVTIHIIDATLDTGDIVLQKQISFKNIEQETLKTTYEKLSTEIELLVCDNFDRLYRGEIKGIKQTIGGSCHRVKDKKAVEYLLEKKGWDTPVCELLPSISRRKLTV